MTFFRKKYYREVPCKACDGTGKAIHNGYESLEGNRIPAFVLHMALKASQGICLACNGKSTQTVLEKVE